VKDLSLNSPLKGHAIPAFSKRILTCYCLCYEL